MKALYTHEYNWKIEWNNQTIMEHVWSVLHHKSFSLQLWAKATHSDAYIPNRISIRLLDGKIPFEAWTNTKPFMAQMKAFGSVCHVHIHKSFYGKLNSKSKLKLFMGYFDEDKAHCI